MDIDHSIQYLPRISPAYYKRLLKLGIKTIRDLFFHFPFRYDDFSNLKNIRDLKPNETATIQGQITSIKNIRTWKKRMNITEAYIQDQTGVIKIVWFNQPYLIKTLKQDDFLSVAGKVNLDKELYLSNPAYERLSPTASGDQRFAISDLRHTGGLVAIYPETAGLSSRWLRYTIDSLLPKFLPQIKDHLPFETKRAQKLLDLNQAIRQIHFPKSQKQASQARRRLAFDELFFIQLFSLQQRAKWRRQNAHKIIFNEPLIKNFVQSLPFKLTDAQRKSAWEILKDLEKPKPMNRLLEGDVGSGKTVVAAIAALQSASGGNQVAFMAPTEILAKQHFETISALLKNQGITIGLLTGSEAITNELNPPRPSFKKEGDEFNSPLFKGNARKGERFSSLFKEPASYLMRGRLGRSALRAPGSMNSMRGIYNGIKKSDFIPLVSSGQIQILIGTHALIQESVKFKNLALVIVDEQHRFGVAQRAALQKSVNKIKDGLAQTIPHLLSMTATPIPRTLALALYGDLDISILDEMPKGRKEIITKIIPPAQRHQAYEFIRQQIKKGRQVFVICPRIEIANNKSPVSPPKRGEQMADRLDFDDQRLAISDKRNWDEVKAVKEEYEKLDKIIFPDLKILMLHGKIKPKEKEKAMSYFAAGRADILVSTSVVEVGVDIPNAAVIMIEGAERFGLAQLHQFRGRVGRGQHQSYCLLFTTAGDGQSNRRLQALIKCQNGFELAQKDLALRGPGDFLGVQQWGLPNLSMASLMDVELVKATREEAQKIIQKDPELKNSPALAEKLKTFQTTLHME